MKQVLNNFNDLVDENKNREDGEPKKLLLFGLMAKNQESMQSMNGGGTAALAGSAMSQLKMMFAKKKTEDKKKFSIGKALGSIK